MTRFSSERLDRTRSSLEIDFLDLNSLLHSKCDTPIARRIGFSVVGAENRQSSV